MSHLAILTRCTQQGNGSHGANKQQIFILKFGEKKEGYQM